MPSLLRRQPAYPHSGETEPKRSAAASTVRLLLGVAILAWAVRSFLFAPFSIPSGSMLPTLYPGDYVLVAKWPYGFSRFSFPLDVPSFDGRLLGRLPKRGDIAVFRSPGGGGDFIKRVVGLPGDRVALRGGTVILNGQPVAREAQGFVAIPISPNTPCRVAPGATPMPSNDARACRYPAYRERLPGGRDWLVLDQVELAQGDHVAELTVPAGRLLLLGDNRDDSLDSRFPVPSGGVGLVPLDHLVGRASLIFWSTDGNAVAWKPWTWFGALRSDRIGRIGAGSSR
jgi:signal peptidase I